MNNNDIMRARSWDILTTSIYDTVTLTNNDNVPMFSIPTGQANKTFADTNMYFSGQLPESHEFTIEEIVLFCMILNHS